MLLLLSDSLSKRVLVALASSRSWGPAPTLCTVSEGEEDALLAEGLVGWASVLCVLRTALSALRAMIPEPRLYSCPPLPQGPESSAGSSADSDQGSGSGWDAVDSPCDISLLERLIRSHPVWFLPGIQRAGAFHLLQAKEEGNFVVRQSSQAATMAISVRLPPLKGPYIEHYLVQANDNGQLSLESSDNRFDSIPQLIAHYCQCCDELPVQLTLPRAIREARNRQQLTSLALLGQEFWRYPMANPRPPDQAASGTGQDSQGVTIRSSASNSQASSLSSLGSGNNNTPVPLDLDGHGLGHGDSIVLNLAPLVYSPDSQPPSLMSTFGKGSESQAQGVASPTCSLGPTSPSAAASGTGPGPGPAPTACTTSTTTSTVSATSALSRAQRPTPPNTLNLVSATTAQGPRSNSASPAQGIQTPSALGGKTPPPPPPRWAKPSLSLSQTPTTSDCHDLSPPPNLESKRPSLESDGLHTPVLSSHSSVSNLTESQSLSLSMSMSLSLGQQAQPQQPRSQGPSQVTSPCASTPNSESLSKSIGRGSGSGGSRRHHRARKESNHYQESDILETSSVYYHSSLADKQSDYEDIWGQEMSTFKPHGPRSASRSSPFSSPETPDTSVGSTGSGLQRLHQRPPQPQPQPDLLERVGTPIVPEPSQSLLLQRNRLGLTLHTNVSQSCGNLTPTNGSHCGSPLPQDSRSPPVPPHGLPAEATTPTGNGNGSGPPSKQGSPFYAEPADAIKQAVLVARRRQRPQPLFFSPLVLSYSELLPMKICRVAKPPRLPVVLLQGLQGYPQAARAAQRHSDPAAFHQWPSATGGRLLERIDSSEELANMSSSADNLALLRNSRSSGSIANNNIINTNFSNINNNNSIINNISNNNNNNNNNNVNNRPRAKPVQPPRIKSGKPSDNSWAVDSSWEFIGNDDDNEAGREAEPDRDVKHDEERRASGPGSGVVTVQDMILQRLPDLRDLPEVVPRPRPAPRLGDSTPARDSSLSAYDNVEGQGQPQHGGCHRGHSAGPGSQHHGSHHGSHHASDNEDALTEFSEPWDTSRWENLLRCSETPDTTARLSMSCPPEDDHDDHDHDPAGDEPPRHPGVPSNALLRQQAGRAASVTRNRSFREKLDPLLCE
ncbi:Protein sprint [Frankliniella fusca]|uniref:Protein sprint n=1 Tax=Frankliniella fusca TaxID=407009 RepID=A0AAE1HSI7_9NEOP|nr:Protein sprint [Frankliniella fusca]